MRTCTYGFKYIKLYMASPAYIPTISLSLSSPCTHAVAPMQHRQWLTCRRVQLTGCFTWSACSALQQEYFFLNHVPWTGLDWTGSNLFLELDIFIQIHASSKHTNTGSHSQHFKCLGIDYYYVVTNIPMHFFYALRHTVSEYVLRSAVARHLLL